MMRKAVGLMVLVVLVLLAACGGGESAGGASADAVLKATGKVKTEMGWSMADLKGMESVSAEYTNKDGETTTFTGVAIKALLDKVEPAADATMLVMVASDGYSAEITLAELDACDTCIVAVGDSLQTVMPGFSGKLQVKDVVELQLK